VSNIDRARRGRPDDRQGAYDPAGDRTKRDTSEAAPHERVQPGAAIQGEPVPTKDFEQLPEGLKRQRKGPYSRTRGRDNG
jgi:hypothetical protein